MLSRKMFAALLTVLLFSLFLNAHPAAADSSHARIIRLNLVQGDVRFTRMAHGDPVSDANAAWETAQMNLPIRQGYVLATDHGRAEVEFENGAMAFLKENTVLEFYDLSLNDSARTTRLVLRQGSASFYVNLGGDDYFSVTGGDFTVEATGKSQFRVDNYDDGSTVETYKGRVSVLHNKEESRLVKGQSLTMKAGDDSSVSIGTLPQEDDFDRWVSGITENASNTATAATQYTGAGYYVPGIVDLYTYGAFTTCGAYGLGWRPFGAGFGWSPFSDGQWILDPVYGWTWLSYQPWGWAPYHYGGWLFDNSCGWFYSPPLGYGYAGYPGVGVPIKKFPRRINPPRPIYHPVTAVFVRQGNKTGIVPMHPLDEKGKTPLNLEHGVFINVGTKGIAAQSVPVTPGEKWQALKSGPREAFSGSLVAAERPDRVSRTLIQGGSGARGIATLGKDSSIAYDPVEHRFVNTNSSVTSTSAKETSLKEEGRVGNPPTTAANAGTSRTSVTPPTTRTAYSPPARSNTVTPPAPRYSSGGRGGGSSWTGGSASSSGSSGGRSSASSSASSASAGSHPSGGRPH